MGIFCTKNENLMNTLLSIPEMYLCFFWCEIYSLYQVIFVGFAEIEESPPTLEENREDLNRVPLR
jgi:hypothetical protein